MNGGDGRCRVGRFFLSATPPRRALQVLGDAAGLLPRCDRQPPLPPGDARQRGDEDALVALGRLLLRPPQGRLDGPVLLRPERLDLHLTLHDQPQRDRLHAPGGEASPPQLAADERAEVVPHQAVQDPARLLRVDQVHVDAAGAFERVQHGVPGDLVEDHAPHPLRRHLRRPRQVPGDRLALPVRVGGQERRGGLPRHLPHLLHQLLAVERDQVLRRHAVVDVHAHARRRQVPHVPQRRLHGVPRPQDAAQRPRLRGRFDDD